MRTAHPTRCYPHPVADLTFSQPARRNFAVPILIALAILAATAFAVLRLTPSRTADLAVTHTSVYAAHTVFKTNSIVVGSDPAQDDLYVLTTLKIDNKLKLPLFLKDFTATLTPAEGEPLTSSAVEKQDIQPLFVTFPALKPLASAPLYRETSIEPGHSAEGMLLLHFPVDQATWDHRKSATLTIALYHQQPQTIEIPK